jgi:hypothetical protein
MVVLFTTAFVKSEISITATFGNAAQSVITKLFVLQQLPFTSDLL